MPLVSEVGEIFIGSLPFLSMIPTASGVKGSFETLNKTDFLGLANHVDRKGEGE
jgi:hypothetical protein